MTDEELERMAAGIVRLRSEIIVRRRDADSSLAAADLTTPQAIAQRVIVEEGRLRMSDLAEALHVSVATASRTVDALAASGLVERHRHADDGRVVHVAATAAGRRDWAARQRAVVRALGRFMEDLSEDERRELAEALETVNRLLVGRSR